MKFILLIMIAILTFALALIGALAATGNLSKEAVEKMVGTKKEAPKTEEKVEPQDDVEPIAKALKERDEQLKQREAKVTEEEQRLKLEQQDISELRTELEQTLKQIMEHINTTDQGDEEALTKLSKTMAAMRPKNAADSIVGLAPEKAARVLRMMKEKESGKILDSMAPEQRALIMRSLTQAAPPTVAAGDGGSTTGAPSASAPAPAPKPPAPAATTPKTPPPASAAPKTAAPK